MATRLETAKQQYQAGDYAAALATARGLVRMGQQLIDAYTVAGAASMGLGDWAGAQKSFENVTRLDRTIPGAWQNLALAALEQNNLALAESCCRTLLVLHPENAEVHYAMAMVLREQGRLVESRPYLRTTLAAQPGHANAAFNLLVDEWGEQPPAVWPDLWNRLPAGLGPTQLALLGQVKVIHAWVVGTDITPVLADALKAVQGWRLDGPVRDRRGMEKTFHSARGFIHMFEILQARGFAPVPALDAALPALYVVGDSHCLPPHGQQVMWQGQSHQLHSRLTIGTKLWHLAQGRASSIKDGAGTPDGATCLISLGEIDQRTDEGLWAWARKYQRDWREGLTKTIPPALDWLMANRGNRTFIMVSPPAPHPDKLASLAAAEREDYVAFVAAFHNILKEATAKRGMDFIDMYTPTLADDGLFLDGVHLLPSVLPNVLTQSLGGKKAENGTLIYKRAV